MAFSIVRYSQQDPRWKDDILGSGRGTIGYIGSALTSAAMYASGWGFGETPGTLNQKLRRVGGYDGQAIVWAAMGKIHPEITCPRLTVCGSSPAPLEDIRGSLASGRPVIVEVDFSPVIGLQTHWLLLYKNMERDFLMLDPWPHPTESTQVSLMSRFGHGESLQRAIKGVAWFECSIAPPAQVPGPLETDLYVWPLESVAAGVRLRPQPSLDRPATYAEMPGVRLNVIEEKAGALAKIGRRGEWIRVRDPSGHQGYVAAWELQSVPDEALPQAPAPPPASEPKKFQVVVVRSVGPLGLAVRQEPSRSAPKVHVEKPGARLTVLEPASTGLPKIGVEDQWLAIKATNNKRGYVAAQYIELRS